MRTLLDSETRFAGIKSEFEDALKKLRLGTPKDLEDAIDEAAMAVESAMKVVLDARTITRTGKEPARPLWELLSSNSVVPAETDNALLANSRLRNVLSGHGTGSAPRVIPPDVPQLAIHAASAALVYLLSRLP